MANHQLISADMIRGFSTSASDCCNPWDSPEREYFEVELKESAQLHSIDVLAQPGQRMQIEIDLDTPAPLTIVDQHGDGNLSELAVQCFTGWFDCYCADLDDNYWTHEELEEWLENSGADEHFSVSEVLTRMKSSSPKILLMMNQKIFSC